MHRKIAVFLLLLVFCASAGAEEPEYYARFTASLLIPPKDIPALRGWTNGKCSEGAREVPSLNLSFWSVSKRKYAKGDVNVTLGVTTSIKAPLSKLLPALAELLKIVQRPEVSELRSFGFHITPVEPYH